VPSAGAPPAPAAAAPAEEPAAEPPATVAPEAGEGESVAPLIVPEAPEE